MEKFPQSGITLGKVTGVILLAGCHGNIPVMEIPVREAKQVRDRQRQFRSVSLKKASVIA
ncbi:MAG: hypothetical protein R2860_07610 [Desulfobacterales bacterium]